MASVELSVDANLSGLRRQLEAIPGITAEEARAMSAELNKSFKASEKAAKSAADASKKAMQQTTGAAHEASAAVADTGDAFGKAGSNSAKLAGALSMVSPQFGEVARNVADFADVGEVAASVLGKFGPIGSAVSVGIAALAVAVPMVSEALADQTVESEALLAQYGRLEAATYAAAEAQAAYDDALSKVKTETDVILGLKSKEQVATEASIDAFRRQTQAQIDAQQAAIVQAEITKQQIREQIDAGATVSDRIELERRLTGRLDEATSVVTKARAEQDKSKSALESYIEVKQAELTVTEAGIAKTERKAKADASAAKAALAKKAAEDRNASAIKSITDEIDAYLKIDAEWQRGLEQGRATLEAQTKAINDEAVKALEGYRSQLETLVPEKPLSDVEKLTMLIADLDTAMLTAPTEELGMRYKAMSDEAVAALEGVKKAQEEAFLVDRLKEYSAQLGQIDQVLGVLTEASSYFSEKATSDYQAAMESRQELGKKATAAEKEAADKRVRDAREAAVKSFLIDKALKIAQAIAATALAATQALALPPAPNFFAAGLAAAAGAVQVAKISSEKPSFHKGGLIGQPDEQSAVVRSGEAVLNPMGRSQLGDETIKAANAGMLTGSTRTAVQVVYKHKSFDYFVRDHLQTNATLPRALGARRRLGHRGG